MYLRCPKMDQGSIGRRPDNAVCTAGLNLVNSPKVQTLKNLYGQIRTTFKQNKL